MSINHSSLACLLLGLALVCPVFAGDYAPFDVLGIRDLDVVSPGGVSTVGCYVSDMSRPKVAFLYRGPTTDGLEWDVDDARWSSLDGGRIVVVSRAGEAGTEGWLDYDWAVTGLKQGFYRLEAVPEEPDPVNSWGGRLLWGGMMADVFRVEGGLGDEVDLSVDELDLEGYDFDISVSHEFGDGSLGEVTVYAHITVTNRGRPIDESSPMNPYYVQLVYYTPIDLEFQLENGKVVHEFALDGLDSGETVSFVAKETANFDMNFYKYHVRKCRVGLFSPTCHNLTGRYEGTLPVFSSYRLTSDYPFVVEGVEVRDERDTQGMIVLDVSVSATQEPLEGNYYLRGLLSCYGYFRHPVDMDIATSVETQVYSLEFPFSPEEEPPLCFYAVAVVEDRRLQYDLTVSRAFEGNFSLNELDPDVDLSVEEPDLEGYDLDISVSPSWKEFHIGIFTVSTTVSVTNRGKAILEDEDIRLFLFGPSLDPVEKGFYYDHVWDIGALGEGETVEFVDEFDSVNEGTYFYGAIAKLYGSFLSTKGVELTDFVEGSQYLGEPEPEEVVEDPLFVIGDVLVRNGTSTEGKIFLDVSVSTIDESPEGRYHLWGRVECDGRLVGDREVDVEVSSGVHEYTLGFPYSGEGNECSYELAVFKNEWGFDDRVSGKVNGTFSLNELDPDVDLSMEDVEADWR